VKHAGIFPALPKGDGAIALAAHGTNTAQQLSNRCSRKELSQDEIQALLIRLRDRCAIHEFQGELRDLRSRGFGNSKKRKLLARLLRIVWKRELSRAGFPVNAFGFPDFLAAVGNHVDQPCIKILAQEIEMNLFFRPGDLFKPVADDWCMSSMTSSASLGIPEDFTEAAACQDVEELSTREEDTLKAQLMARRRAQLAAQRKEHTLEVQVRDASDVSQPAVADVDPFMEQLDNTYVSLPDSEPLGEARSLVMRGLRPELAAPDTGAKKGLPEQKGSPLEHTEVVVTHAFRKREVRFRMPVTVTVQEVKEVLLHKYPHPPQPTDLRLATRHKNNFQFLNDEEPLAGRHELVALGLTMMNINS